MESALEVDLDEQVIVAGLYVGDVHPLAVQAPAVVVHPSWLNALRRARLFCCAFEGRPAEGPIAVVDAVALLPAVDDVLEGLILLQKQVLRVAIKVVVAMTRRVGEAIGRERGITEKQRCLALVDALHSETEHTTNAGFSDAALLDCTIRAGELQRLDSHLIGELVGVKNQVRQPLCDLIALAVIATVFISAASWAAHRVEVVAGGIGQALTQTSCAKSRRFALSAFTAAAIITALSIRAVPFTIYRKALVVLRAHLSFSTGTTIPSAAVVATIQAVAAGHTVLYKVGKECKAARIFIIVGIEDEIVSLPRFEHQLKNVKCEL